VALKYSTADVTENVTQDATCRESQNANRIFSLKWIIFSYWKIYHNALTCLSIDYGAMEKLG